MDLRTWIAGLISALSGAVAAALGLLVADPVAFNFGTGLRKILIVCAFTAAVSLLNYLKQSPLPGGKDKIPFIAYILIPLFLLGAPQMQGCAPQGTTQQVAEPFEVKAWKGLNLSISAYDGAMQSLKKLYADGVISTPAAQKAWDAGEGFYLAQKAGIEALRVYKMGKSAQTQQALDAAIITAGGKLAQFTVLVTPYLTKMLVDDLNTASQSLKGGK